MRINKKIDPILTKPFLIKEYIENKKSTLIIAKELNTNKHIIRRRLIKYGILRRTLSQALKGREFTLECRKKMSKNHRNIKGKNNPNWQGNNIGYSGIHRRIRLQLPKPNLCNNCKKIPPYDLTNKSGKYKQNLSDWEWLCRKCHMQSDGRLDNLHKIRPRLKDIK